MKVILTDLFQSRNMINNELIDIILSCTLAYGLCSYKKQIDLVEHRYRDDRMTHSHIKSMKDFYDKNLDSGKFDEQHTGFLVAEAQGIRIAETTNDGRVLTFLKELLGNEIDGFIAPEMFSPYHVNNGYYTSPEMILFDPVKSHIVELSQDEIPKRTEEVSIRDITLCQFGRKNITYKNYLKTSMRGGQKNNTKADKNSVVSFQFESYFQDSKNEEERKSIQQIGNKLKEKCGYFFPEKPAPSHRIRPWC